MKSVIKLCDTIKHSKTNASIDLIRANKDNEKFLAVLDFVYNPFVVSGISTAKITKKVQTKPTQTFNTFVELLNYIKKNNTGSDKVLANVQNYLDSLSPKNKEFASSVITKKLRLGVNIKSINKGLERNFIPEFQVQLAKKFYDEKSKLEMSKKEFVVTQKIDGFRCVAVKHNGKATLYARSGKPIVGCVSIERALNNIPLDDFVLDGELVSEDLGSSSADRYKATSKILLADGVKKNLCFILFDYLSYDEFVAKKSHSNYDRRMNCLKKIFEVIQQQDTKHFSLVPTYYQGDDLSVIDKLMKKVQKEKLEGLMINIVDAHYEFKRTCNLLKVKMMNECDLLIVDYKMGSGEFEGMLGALICEYKGNLIQVGSGFTISQRRKFCENPKKYIGKIAKVQYFEETQNQNGNYSLRFPVFLEIRKDKNTPNY